MNDLKLVELRPNRDLLNFDFDGYKLSLTQIDSITEQLKVPVDRLIPNINQYSLLHAKLYVLHNHLVGESRDTESVYFFDKELNLQKYTIEVTTNQFSCSTIWSLQLQKERSPGDYNISMKLASDKIGVVADGAGFIYVLDRGSKDIEEKWTVIYSDSVTGSDQNFIITDAVYKDTLKPQLHLLLTSIKQKGENERCSTILHWISLEKTNSWNQVALRELTVDGFVQYTNLERTCEAIYVISDSGCKFTLDSENEIHDDEKELQPEKKKYKWSQGTDEITIKLPFTKNINKDLINVTTEPNKISIKYDNEIILEGTLYQKVDSIMTTWNLENLDLFGYPILEVVIQKTETGLMWPEIIEADRFGEYVSDSGLVEEIVDRLAPFTSSEESTPPSGTTFNSEQVEECDFESDYFTIFERVCKHSHKVTHKVNLGSHKVLLTVNLDKSMPLAFATRNDVDACIWQPVKDTDFCIEHKGTLFALGYIQASKQQMKFFVCAPDLRYCVISESTKHIFIYCQNKTIYSSELKNRLTGRRVNTVSQQQLYSLPNSDEILGLYASNSFLYVLGEKFITALKL